MRAIFAVTYRDAVRQLARDRNFRNAISGMAAAKRVPDPSDEPPLAVKLMPRFTGGITSNMKNILPAVVEIKHSHGVGAGFVIDARGYLLTNAHVVGDVGSIMVRFNDGQALEASVLRRDTLRDVALLKVERGGLRPIPIRSGRLTLTEKVFAVGNPLNLSQTVTDGIVSAYRELPENAQEYVQVAINIGAGNSGGPLLDASGNVVGVTASGRTGGVRPVNFFVPIDAALERLNVQLGK
jgi:S1-C subfamily serine protease